MYEYKVEKAPCLNGTITLAEWLNRQGSDGWIMVSQRYGCFYFKRKVPQAEQ